MSTLCSSSFLTGGIFYQAFEPDFNLSFSRAFGVSIMQLDESATAASDDAGSVSTRVQEGEGRGTRPSRL